MTLKSLCLTTLTALFAVGCSTSGVCDTYYRDRDEDGFGDPESTRFTCGQPNNYVTNDRDCNDDDPNDTPTATYEGDLVLNGADPGDLAAFVATCPGTVAGNITVLDTQREDMDFLNSVSVVEGTLTLAGNALWDDLRDLQNLTELGGLTLAVSTGLRDLDDLDNLKTVGSLNVALFLNGDDPSLEVFSDLEGLRDLSVNVTGISDYTGLPELTELEGDLSIGGANITSLAGIDTIETVGGVLELTNFRQDVDFTTLGVTEAGGGLRIVNNELLTTVELTNLTSAASIDVRNNASLTTLRLPGLTTTGSVSLNSNALLETVETGLTTATDLDFTNLPALAGPGGFSSVEGATVEGLIVRNTGFTTLEGLEGVTAVNGSAQVVGNPALSTTSGLDGLATIGGQFQIVNNEGLTAVTGLGALQSVEQALEITDSPDLVSLEGLDSLQTVGSLTIQNNLGLTSLDGIETLTTADFILVEDNRNLASIAGLDGVTTVTEEAAFLNNPILFASDVDAWCSQLTTLCINEGNRPSM